MNESKTGIEVRASEVISAISSEVRLNSPANNGAWTQAIYDGLKQLALQKQLAIFPAEKPKKGEYLLDFILWKPHFGPVVCVESQWQFWRNDNLEGINWAFDKLRGVKGQLKVLIFEWKRQGTSELPPTINKLLTDCLSDFELHVEGEQYLLMWFCGSTCEAFEWSTLRSGRHRAEEILFSHVSSFI